jgi:hypothetical protein
MVLSACEKSCGDIEGRAIDDSKKSENVTVSEALAGCNKSRVISKGEALSCGLTYILAGVDCPSCWLEKNSRQNGHTFISLNEL